jgi:hypothetical protein
MEPQILLDPNWEWVDGTYTLSRKGRSNINTLQISIALNKEEKILGISALDMLALNWVERIGGKSLQQFRGQCSYGEFSSSIFSAEDFPHCQLWCISNGIHFIFATFICDVTPTAEELNEVEAMALSLTLG